MEKPFSDSSNSMRLVFNQKTIYNCIWIFCCIGVFLFAERFPFGFSKNEYVVIFYFILSLGFLISFIWTVNNVFRIKTQVFTIVAIVISIPIILISILGNSMCGYSDSVLFKNKSSKSDIVARSYGCGAYDNDFPHYRYYKRTSLLGSLHFYERIDTSTLDKSTWRVAD